jgi:hypothetical protein
VNSINGHECSRFSTISTNQSTEHNLYNPNFNHATIRPSINNAHFISQPHTQSPNNIQLIIKKTTPITRQFVTNNANIISPLRTQSFNNFQIRTKNPTISSPHYVANNGFIIRRPTTQSPKNLHFSTNNIMQSTPQRNANNYNSISQTQPYTQTFNNIPIVTNKPVVSSPRLAVSQPLSQQYNNTPFINNIKNPSTPRNVVKNVNFISNFNNIQFIFFSIQYQP